MGNRISRNNLQKKLHLRRLRTCLSNKNFDRQRFKKHHMDTHSNEMDKVLNDDLILMDSNVDTQQLAINIHKNALNIALKNHMKAANLNTPNYQQVQQITYTFQNNNSSG